MYIDRIPDGILSQQDVQVVRASGWGKRRGFGKKLAVLVVDAQYAFVGAKANIMESLKGNSMGIGDAAWRAVGQIAVLLEEARKWEIPVIYCRAKRTEAVQPFNWTMFKRFKTNEPSIPGVNAMDIVEELVPLPNEVVLDKQFASAFFGTPLQSYLTTLGIDTLIVTGFVTAGCVRASVNDACSNGYNTIVVEDCVADRFVTLHHAELLTMDLKYADVMPLSEVLENIVSIQRG